MRRFTYVMILALLLSTAFVGTAQARSSGSRSGGSRSYSSHSSPSRSSTPKSSTSKPTAPKTTPKAAAPKASTPSKPSPSKPKTSTQPKQSTKPGSTVKTPSGKTVKTSPKKPSNAKYSRSTGISGVNGYNPQFRGYNAPAGSVVYYPQHSFVDYLPWIYLFSQSSPRQDTATIVQPDGKEVKAAPVKEGTDGLVWVNWIVMFILGLGLIALIAYLVYKFSNKED